MPRLKSPTWGSLTAHHSVVQPCPANTASHSTSRSPHSPPRRPRPSPAPFPTPLLIPPSLPISHPRSRLLAPPRTTSRRTPATRTTPRRPSPAAVPAARPAIHTHGSSQRRTRRLSPPCSTRSSRHKLNPLPRLPPRLLLAPRADRGLRALQTVRVRLRWPRAQHARPVLFVEGRGVGIFHLEPRELEELAEEGGVLECGGGGEFGVEVYALRLEFQEFRELGGGGWRRASGRRVGDREIGRGWEGQVLYRCPRGGVGRLGR